MNAYVPPLESTAAYANSLSLGNEPAEAVILRIKGKPLRRSLHAESKVSSGVTGQFTQSGCTLSTGGGHFPIARCIEMTKLLRRLALVLAGTVSVASLISGMRTPVNADAPLLAGAQVPPAVRFALERACRDCHSDATRYPWYSYIAPVSWLVNRDVKRGRERLNLSKWSEYSVTRRERCLSDIANQLQDGRMPPAIYTLMHRDAKLPKAEIDAVFEWTQAERVRLIMESAAVNSSQ